MKKTKLKRDARPQRKGFFEQKHIDIYRQGGTLVFSDTSIMSSATGDYVEPLKYICFTNNCGYQALIDIEKGCIEGNGYSADPYNNDTNHGFQDFYSDPRQFERPQPRYATAPHVEFGTPLTSNAVTVLVEQVVTQMIDISAVQDLVVRIAILESKISELELERVNRE